MGLVGVCDYLPTGMPLTHLSYEARCHLNLCSTIGSGSLPYFFGIVEERAPVRIGIRDPIVAIEVQRARIVAIVGIAQQFGTTQTALGSSTYFSKKSGCKVTPFLSNQQVKERFRLLFIQIKNIIFQRLA